MTGMDGRDEKRVTPSDTPASESGEFHSAELTSEDPIRKLSKALAEKFDSAGISGSLKEDILGKVDDIAKGIGGVAGRLMAQTYEMALEVYAEKFPNPSSLAVEFEYQGAAQGLVSEISEAESRGISEQDLIPLIVAHNSIITAIGCWGGTGVLGMPSTANPTLEGQNVKKAKILAPDLSYQLVCEEGVGAGVKVDNGRGADFTISISSISERLESFKSINWDQIPAGEQRDGLKLLLKASLDTQQAFLVCLASHFAGCPGIVNARGALLKIKPGNELPQELKSVVARALTDSYERIKTVSTDMGLDTLPSLAEAIGGEIR